jgi:AmmeMemoRadiSam system protein A
VFVSFHDRHDVLRGCIGTVLEAQPLYKTVQEMAVAAATRDPRYRPVRLDELAKLTIEVSVLGERRTVTSPGEIQIGVHGLQVISQPPRPARGLLLPKVAVDQGWDVETFLARTCDKADLESDWWKGALAGQGGVVERFTAQVFDEKTLQVGPYAPASGSG